MQEYSARTARITAIRPPNALCATAPWISTGSLNGHRGSAITSRIWAFERAAPATKQPLILNFVRFWCVAAIVSPKIFAAMITITELQQKDAARAYQEFFRDEFRSQRLGSFGHWLGRGGRLLGLESPASQAKFHNLVHGLTPDGSKRLLEGSQDPNRVALWQIDFTGSQSLSLLWAMSPGTWRWRIESAHMTAAMDALGRFQLRAVDRQQGHSPGNDAATLSVLFSYGASHDQTPHLKTTVFALTHGFLKNGSTLKLIADDLNRQKEKMTASYAFAVRAYFVDLIGPFQKVQGIRDLRIVGVPQEVVRRFFFDPSFNRDSGFEKNGKPLEDTQLFAKWRAQGERLGWGVDQAKALLRESNRQKYWDDLKSDFRAKIRETAQRVSDWKESWKPKTKQTESPQPEKASHSKVEGHKHSH